jgi:transcriptional regulator with XRE-family HTH domain
MREKNGRTSTVRPPVAIAAIAADPELRRSLGTRLKRLRRHHGKTQVALAAEIGSHAWAISRIERGCVATFSPELLLALARALRVSVDYLLAGGRAGMVRDPRLAQRLNALNSLPAEQAEQLLRLLDAYLDQPEVAVFTEPA